MYVAKPPAVPDLLGETPVERLSKLFQASISEGGREYLHWDKLRHLDPPDGLSHREWWLGLKLSRQGGRRRLPLLDPDGTPFSFVMPDSVMRLLHYVDQHCSGEIAMQEVVTADDQARQHYLVNSMMEEAIRSSQLEGASTTRTVAKELLRSGRPPKDRSERMIMNNYRALDFARNQIGDVLRPSHVLELQRILTEGTLHNADAAGRLQTTHDERVAVIDNIDGSVIHKPPPADQLPERLERLCEFANAPDDTDDFVHPVIRSILLHFWLAYDHPFEDGNGRTSRLLFYWSMRKHGYWLTEYLSISRILRQGPSKYVRSFLLSETDEGDTTYFIHFQLSVIKRAVEELHTYLRRKIKEVQKVQSALSEVRDLNHRQLALLSHAGRNPNQVYTFRSHATTHNVTQETARTDLLHLWRRDLLTRRKAGRRYVFGTPPDLAERLGGRVMSTRDAAASPLAG